MILALILDIDGVLVGEKIGVNSPYPHADVIKRLAAIRARGIPVILCTAKPHYSILPIIQSAKLTNPHITYAGGVIIDPIKDQIIETHPLPKPIASEIIAVCLERQFYTEVYTLNEYYLLRRQVSDLTRIHTHILQHEPILVDALDAIAKTQDIYKITPVVPNESGMPAVESALSPFKDALEITWSLHPIAMPHQFCGIAPKGISKRQAATTVLSHLGIDASAVLGVGDSTSDWKFMELCGFAATLENGQDPLKALISAKGDAGFIGGHVDTNGILSIFDHFHLP
ncbi:MAG: HAD family hydrolase [Patescibacteria group bacterium]